MSRAAKWDVVASGILAAVSTGVFVETRDYPASSVAGAPGPAFFPRILAGVLLLLALLLVVQALLGGSDASSKKKRLGAAESKKIAGTIAISTVFVAFLAVGDFYLMAPLLLAGVMVIMGERTWWKLVVVPLAFDGFVYLVFFRLFGVMLPSVIF